MAGAHHRVWGVRASMRGDGFGILNGADARPTPKAHALLRNRQTPAFRRPFPSLRVPIGPRGAYPVLVKRNRSKPETCPSTGASHGLEDAAVQFWWPDQSRKILADDADLRGRVGDLPRHCRDPDEWTQQGRACHRLDWIDGDSRFLRPLVQPRGRNQAAARPQQERLVAAAVLAGAEPSRHGAEPSRQPPDVGGRYCIWHTGSAGEFRDLYLGLCRDRLPEGNDGTQRLRAGPAPDMNGDRPLFLILRNVAVALPSRVRRAWRADNIRNDGRPLAGGRGNPRRFP